MVSLWNSGRKQVMGVWACGLLFAAPNVFGQNAAEVTSSFHLVQNAADNSHFTAKLILENKSKETLKDWKLHFNFVRPIMEVKGAELVQDKDRTGDYYVFKGENKHVDLAPGEKLEFDIKGQWFLKHDSDAPAGYFVSFNDKNNERRILDIKDSVVIAPDWKPKDGEDAESLQKKNLQASIEGNAPRKETLRGQIVPAPVSVTESNKPAFVVNDKTVIVAKTPEAKEAALFFAKAIEKATGFQLTISDASKEKSPKNAIVFVQAPKQKDEGYELEANDQQVLLKAKDAAGFHYAAQTLRQLLPAAVYGETLRKDVTWSVPAGKIVDYPRFSYRGLHLDVARNFMPIEDVRRLIDLMALHKLNRFHWHLTDDEGWRIEIKAYPQLTEVGAWRGYGLPLNPTLGSGSQRQGGFYTQEQIKEVVQYAKERQISIIPEIDMPGHSRALIKSLPEKLVDTEDKSKYESVQRYSDNVLSPCIEGTFEVIDTIVAEVAQIFPGDTIHIGADEVPQGVWDPTKSPNCQKLMASQGLKDKAQLQNYFFKRVKATLEKHSKQAAGWEELAIGADFKKKDVLAYAWKPEMEGLKLLKEGYDLVLTPANFLYFDLAYSEDPREPGYYWAGTIDTFKAYSYAPVPAGLSKAEKSHVKGVQACVWSETIRSRSDLDYKTFPRVSAFSEVAWSPAERRDWGDFSRRLNQYLLPRLDQYGVQYRRAAPGNTSAKNEASSPVSKGI